ncbi:ADP-ribosylation factor-binding protein GGA2 [Penicillium subrubescens]|uniref:ADP-ribosylation factor-binding protein GGA2 n=1 Tax=Penicillium subrubescens TaxID=1316194 RepID=A0A1Q5T0N4_9EURO|nr:ADP-ribosylation factor-binding protein GGA2 [Penicillium subrubescens]KAJ5911439.1 ADP-ribosylation factor-binding protein GGA2 [Penicillium subrubescens]OKO93829.1 ADP-ribosylation factor-binding protein GGA2 [Penicillium subrubescens]
MAARDRFGAYAEPGLSPLQRAIRNACDPQNYEPNLALNLEVADLVNSKKGNSPREAAVEIVHLINARNQNIALLALALLDICVKNCGYPFHLQISTKEFLNELVRRFPERPPMRPSRVQHRILESIEEWRQTICQTSRYKEDLGFIRDMHRLLLYKGYAFPEVRREDAAVLNPSDNLRSAEEMEEEEKEAQSAKLQELIRRGTPADLQEANRLMKVMAGYDNRHKTDYRAKAAEEVAKVQQKAKILEEMLQSQQPGDGVPEGDVFEELANALQSAHPKIQKMCEEESEDPEAVHKLLEINDSIHRTIERYKLVRKGDFDAASKIPKGTLGTTTGVSKNANNELSLIDFDPEPAPSSNGNAGPSSQGGSALENDLLGLSLGEEVPALGGGISLGSSSMGFPLQTGPSPPAASPQPSQQAPAAFKANYDILASMTSSRPNSQSSTPAPGISPRPQSTATPPQAADPFAALVSASPRPTSGAFQPPTSHVQAAPSSSLLDLAAGVTPPPQPQPTGQAPAAEDDEWNFASSLPPSNALPSTNKVQVLNSQLRIDFVARRVPSAPRQIHIQAVFSNTTNQPIGELHFQVAVEKSYTLQLHPQSGREVAPQQQYGVKQEMVLDRIDNGKGNSVKIRFKVSYRLGAEAREEQGMVPSLGIA